MAEVRFETSSSPVYEDNTDWLRRKLMGRLIEQGNREEFLEARSGLDALAYIQANQVSDETIEQLSRCLETRSVLLSKYAPERALLDEREAMDCIYISC